MFFDEQEQNHRNSPGMAVGGHDIVFLDVDRLSHHTTGLGFPMDQPADTSLSKRERLIRLEQVRPKIFAPNSAGFVSDLELTSGRTS